MSIRFAPPLVEKYFDSNRPYASLSRHTEPYTVAERVAAHEKALRAQEEAPEDLIEKLVWAGLSFNKAYNAYNSRLEIEASDFEKLESILDESSEEQKTKLLRTDMGFSDIELKTDDMDLYSLEQGDERLSLADVNCDLLGESYFVRLREITLYNRIREELELDPETYQMKREGTWIMWNGINVPQETVDRIETLCGEPLPEDIGKELLDCADVKGRFETSSSITGETYESHYYVHKQAKGSDSLVIARNEKMVFLRVMPTEDVDDIIS